MKIEEHVSLREHTTFKLNARARYFAVVRNIDDLKEALILAKDKNISVFILGGGSNILIDDNAEIDMLFVKIEISEFEKVNENENFVDIKIGSGENWDFVVERAVNMNLSGIEAMSAIPGTIGATPIQNVGAYGQEIKDTLIDVALYDKESGEIKKFTNEECEFSYRDSIFKHRAKDKYVILYVTLRLSKSAPKMPDYPGVKKYFDNLGITNPNIREIRDAIIAIRGIKLPDPKVIASVGSFFKNPIIRASLLREIRNSYSSIPSFEMGGGMHKVPAGWLIDTLGWKGKDFGNLKLYEQNALVIVNKGDATFSELQSVVYEIKKAVFGQFGIELEQEPIEIS